LPGGEEEAEEYKSDGASSDQKAKINTTKRPAGGKNVG
jgi:hypothetical protein